ncbi:hypothetical protein [Streptomyces glomeratus]|nr:hypothetical protein [Streptomyces glomeratus]MCF1511415.1 hypothetical protein [Streptomyces glomeratus]
MQTWRDSRSRADNATNPLREALAALGLPERVRRHLQPMLTHQGAPFVHVRMLSAEHVERIAEALRIAAEAPSLAAASSGTRS